MKNLLLDYVRLLPVVVMVALCGLLFAYAIGTQESQLAVVAFVPGLSLYIFTQLLKAAPSRRHADPVSDVIKRNLYVAVIVTSVALFFSVNALISAILYQIIGIPHAASICFKAFAVGTSLTICMLVSAVLKINVALSPNSEEAPRRSVTWRPVLACLMVTVFAIPSSFSQHNHNYSHVS